MFPPMEMTVLEEAGEALQSSIMEIGMNDRLKILAPDLDFFWLMSTIDKMRCSLQLLSQHCSQTQHDYEWAF